MEHVPLLGGFIYGTRPDGHVGSSMWCSELSHSLFNPKLGKETKLLETFFRFTTRMPECCYSSALILHLELSWSSGIRALQFAAGSIPEE
jgi:hypothetical protein